MTRSPRLKALSCVLIVSALAATSGTAHAYQLLDTKDGAIDLWGRGQLLGIGENIPNETARSHERAYLYLEQARLGTYGRVFDYKFYTELSLGGEDATTSSNIALTLLEFRFDVPLNGATFIRVGEYKVPYGREFLSDDGALQFPHRSIDNLGFFLGRDVGAAIGGRNGDFSGAIGVYTGGSRDIPERYLPESMGIPLIAMRIGLDSTHEDAFANKTAGNFNVEHTEKATYLSAAYMKDSIIGHSTVLNLRPTDRNLLIDPNWNPYLAQTPFAKTQLLQGALDGVVRTPVNGYVLSLEGELNAGMATNQYGTVRMYGGRVQGSADKKPWELAARYAVLLPDSRFAAGGQTKFAPGSGPLPITPTGSPISEISPSVTYYLKDWSKITLALNLLVNVPVIHEVGIGSYVATEQPDQTVQPISAGANGTSTVTGSIDREFVPEVQLMWQMTF